MINSNKIKGRMKEKQIIPIAKAYFTRTRIESIAQAVFDRIRNYAKQYAQKIEK